jgi:hypothetical protein
MEYAPKFFSGDSKIPLFVPVDDNVAGTVEEIFEEIREKRHDVPLLLLLFLLLLLLLLFLVQLLLLLFLLLLLLLLRFLAQLGSITLSFSWKWMVE